MKKLVALMLGCCLMLSLAACGKEMTLNLSYGDRTGTYSGDVNEQGLPHGQGKFTSTNDEGEKWTYEGEFKNGHFDGEGKTMWKSGTVEIGTYKDDVIVPMKGDEIKTLYTTPENFKDHYVEIIGQVFTTPEFDEDGVCIQMWEDVEKSENNTIVYIMDKDFDVEQDDYIRIVGKVGDAFEGENAFGGTVSAPTIIAKEYEVLSYQDALMPTLKTIDVNETQTQYGYSVTLQKIELAEKETRVYLKVDNQGADTFNVYSFNAKITQAGKQFEEQYNWNTEYPKIQSNLLIGNSTEGIITFPNLNDSVFTVIIDASSDNWEEDIKPYTFNIQG